jgi:hypothetical protein
VKGRDRNAPCWCGSGKKFKKCHLDREQQPKQNLWDAVDANRRAFSKKTCFAHNRGLGECDGSIIRAHTVSRGPNLSRISVDGHVLQFSGSVADLLKSGGELVLKKIGINDASVFYGFCRRHDRDLFSCIENEPFTGRADQCLAVAYRTMSRELYGKDASAHLRETLREADKGQKPSQQFLLQSILDDINIGNEAARREQKATLGALTEAMAKGTPDTIESVVFEFEKPLPFMFAGAWSPFTDIYDEPLQEGYEDELLEQIIVSSFAAEEGALICFSWRKTKNSPGSFIATQLISLPDDLRASACLQLVIKHLDNVFFNPDWFDSLTSAQKDQLNKLAADGLDIFGSVPSAPILLDIEFSLPRTLRSFQVGS